MYECESWTIKKAKHQRIDAFKFWCWRRLLRVPWTARRSNQSVLKEINAEYSLKDWCCSWSSNIWPPDVKSWLIGKDPDARKDWRQEEKGVTEDEIVGWHHRLNAHEFEQAPGDGEGQGSLACFSPWSCKESDKTATEQQWENVKGLWWTLLLWSSTWYPMASTSLEAIVRKKKSKSMSTHLKQK